MCSVDRYIDRKPVIFSLSSSFWDFDMSNLQEKILKDLEEINEYELNQTDSYTNQTQLLFLIATVVLGTSFLTIISDKPIIIISKLLTFILVIIALYFAMPYLRKREYIIFPEFDELRQYIPKDDASYDEFIRRLIEFKMNQHEKNSKQNAKRERDFKVSAVLLFISILLTLILFTMHFILKA